MEGSSEDNDELNTKTNYECGNESINSGENIQTTNTSSNLNKGDTEQNVIKDSAVETTDIKVLDISSEFSTLRGSDGGDGTPPPTEARVCVASVTKVPETVMKPKVGGDGIPPPTEARVCVASATKVPETVMKPKVQISCDLNVNNAVEDIIKSEKEIINHLNDKKLIKKTIGTTNEKSNKHSSCANCIHLGKQLSDEQKRCSILRENIHKVSANWFQRKCQVSESDIDSDVTPMGLLSETTRITHEDNDDVDNNGEEEDMATSKEGGKEKDTSKPTTKKRKSVDLSKLFLVIAQKSAQLDIADSQCRDLKKRMRGYEKLIEDQDKIIHGLKDQLEVYLNDNQKMALQLNHLAQLFQQLEKVDKTGVAPTQVPEQEPEIVVPLPTEHDFQDMASSVSRTYIKLKDMIYEKRNLVTEIERLNTLNVELQRRVLQQETRLLSVTDAIHNTWLIVEVLQEKHAKIHEDKVILRYELRAKREILTQLRKELESSREQWKMIRQKTFECEQEYTSIRAMFQKRKEVAENGGIVTVDNPDLKDQDNGDAACSRPEDVRVFEPPIDLLLEMAIEYGIVGEDAEMAQTVHDAITGEDIRDNRLEQLEEHCSLLYTKLLASTSRSLSLAARLSHNHNHYGSSEELAQVDFDDHEQNDEEDSDEEDDVDDDDDDDEDNILYFTDENQLAIMDSVLSSPDSEGYDTAYVSETDGVDMTHIDADLISDDAVPSTFATEVIISITTVTNPEEGSSTSFNDHLQTPESSGTKDTNSKDELKVGKDNLGEHTESDDEYDSLSRTLINFLPKKIEILREENGRLENCLQVLSDEKDQGEQDRLKMEKENGKLENELKLIRKDAAIERVHRKQLEEQLRHLGNCVDQLTLKHKSEKNGTANTAAKCTTENGDETNGEEENGEEENGDETNEEEEERGAEERKKEDERMRKDMGLVRRELELQKKEKEMKDKEKDFMEKEKDFKEMEKEIKNTEKEMKEKEKEFKDRVKEVKNREEECRRREKEDTDKKNTEEHKPKPSSGGKAGE